MDDLYFSCLDCRCYVEIGKRWALSKLDRPGIITSRAPVDVQRVLDASEYWKPLFEPETDERSMEILLSVKLFLTQHGQHNVVFQWQDDLPDDHELTWLKIGGYPEPSVRYLVEVLGFREWDKASEWLSTDELAVFKSALKDDAERDAFRAAFEALVKTYKPK